MVGWIVRYYQMPTRHANIHLVWLSILASVGGSSGNMLARTCLHHHPLMPTPNFVRLVGPSASKPTPVVEPLRALYGLCEYLPPFSITVIRDPRNTRILINAGIGLIVERIGADEPNM